MKKLHTSAFTLVLVAAMSAGCGGGHKPTNLIVATDDSGGCRAHLPAFAAITSQAVDALDPDDGDHLAAFRMDRTTECFYDDLAPDSPDSFDEGIVREFSTSPKRPGTFPAACWSAISRKCDRSAGYTEILVETDGDDDQDTSASRKEIEAAAARLAANKTVVAVAIVGVSDENRDVLEAEFHDLGPNRFRIFGISQLSDGSVQRFLGGAEGDRQ